MTQSTAPKYLFEEKEVGQYPVDNTQASRDTGPDVESDAAQTQTSSNLQQD